MRDYDKMNKDKNLEDRYKMINHKYNRAIELIKHLQKENEILIAQRDLLQQKKSRNYPKKKEREE